MTLLPPRLRRWLRERANSRRMDALARDAQRILERQRLQEQIKAGIALTQGLLDIAKMFVNDKKP